MIAMSKNSDPLAPVRKRKLQIWIDGKYDGKRAIAAEIAGKPLRQFTDLLRKSSARSFGAQLARELEDKLGMPRNYLDTNDNEIPKNMSPPGWPFSFPRRLYDQLGHDEQQLIEGMILGRIVGFVGDGALATAKKRRGAGREGS
jgi:hypothetical protein